MGDDLGAGEQMGQKKKKEAHLSGSGAFVVLFCSGVCLVCVLGVVGRGLKLLVDSLFSWGACLSDQSQALEVSGPSSGGVLGPLSLWGRVRLWWCVSR